MNARLLLNIFNHKHLEKLPDLYLFQNYAKNIVNQSLKLKILQ